MPGSTRDRASGASTTPRSAPGRPPPSMPPRRRSARIPTGTASGHCGQCSTPASPPPTRSSRPTGGAARLEGCSGTSGRLRGTGGPGSPCLRRARARTIAGGREEPLRPAVALRSGEDTCTPAEQDALAALRAAHPDLAAGFAPALRRARAEGLGKLWGALAREQLDGITVVSGECHTTLLLPDGAGVRGPRARGLSEMFAEHPPGLSVTLSGDGHAIDHPVALLDAVIRSCRGRACPTEWGQLSDEVADSVANHALALVGESWRRERLPEPGPSNALAWARRRSAVRMDFSPLAVFEQAVVD